MSITGTGQLAAVVRSADRIDYWIRRHVHAIDFFPAELWSAPQAARRSRVNDAPQRKLHRARDGNVWLSIGHCLKAQYDALAPPVPPHIAALVEQLERQNRIPAAMTGRKKREVSLFEEQGGASCIYKGGIGSITIP
jgi:hypothetical protein